MENKALYEYAVIRVMPRVEREEFFNAGIILFSKERKYLGCKWQLRENRLHCFEIDHPGLILAHLRVFEDIANGICVNSPVSRYPIAERFRWLTATRSTIIQTSRIHAGYAADPEQELLRLFELYAG